MIRYQYILKLWFVFYCINVLNFTFVLSSCVNIERIDAITTFTNGTTFVVSQDKYWLLQQNEKPTPHNSKLLNEISPEISKVQSAANIKIAIDKNGYCKDLNQQIILLAQNLNGSDLIKKYETDQWTELSDFEIFKSNSSIDFTKNIDAIAYLEKVVIIFQNQIYSTLKCEHNQWIEIKHANISSSFSNVKGPIDSALFMRTKLSFDDILLYIFQGKNYFICSIYNSEPCSGPFSIIFDYFNLDSHCGDSLTLELFKYTLTSALIVILIMFIISFGYLLGTRSNQIIFWVNHSNRTNDPLRASYEALKVQKDLNDIGTNGFHDSTNVKFIPKDSNN